MAVVLSNLLDCLSDDSDAPKEFAGTIQWLIDTYDINIDEYVSCMSHYNNLMPIIIQYYSTHKFPQHEYMHPYKLTKNFMTLCDKFVDEELMITCSDALLTSALDDSNHPAASWLITKYLGAIPNDECTYLLKKGNFTILNVIHEHFDKLYININDIVSAVAGLLIYKAGQHPPVYYNVCIKVCSHFDIYPSRTS